MTCAASHAFQVSSGVVGTILAKPTKNDGSSITHSGVLSIFCGRAHAIQSKPGASATSFVTAYLLYVLIASRVSTRVHCTRARAVSSPRTDLAATAAFGRPASVNTL